MLNPNSLCAIEDVLIYLRKYSCLQATDIALTATESPKTFRFPNKYIIEGTVMLTENSTSINDDIDTIDYQNGLVTFKADHTVAISSYTYLKFDYSDRYNLERQINTISAFIEKYTDRKLKTTSYTDEEYPGNGKQLLQLKQWPVTTIESVKIGDSALETTEYSMNSQDALRGQIFKQDGWTWEGYITGFVGEPAAPLRSIKVSYTAGYDIIPSDLQDVVVKMVADAVGVQKSGANGLQQITQGELTYKWQNQKDMADSNVFGLAINPDYAKVLNLYKRYSC